MTARPDVVPFLDKPSGSYSYLVADMDRRRAAIVDPVLEYEPKAARTSTAGAERIVEEVERRGLAVDWILETHVHADRLSAGGFLRDRLGGRLAIGARVTEVQAALKDRLGLDDLATDGSQFDHLFADGEGFRVGGVAAHAFSTPGHTPACLTYLIGDALFVGDTLFMPDSGTARCDFPGGDAHALYASIRKILRLPAETRIFVCHDYAPSREHQCETTVGAERSGNIHVNERATEDEFVRLRKARDRTLEAPTLILPSLQVNLPGGRLPKPDAKGRVYLRIPLNVL
jgi:glyoxylase-like metal-dependent hydrolase (beta-lactamase superfamily II)